MVAAATLIEAEVLSQCVVLLTPQLCKPMDHSEKCNVSVTLRHLPVHSSRISTPVQQASCILPCKFHVIIGQFLLSMFGELVPKPHSLHFVQYRTKGHKTFDEIHSIEFARSLLWCGLFSQLLQSTIVLML